MGFYHRQPPSPQGGHMLGGVRQPPWTMGQQGQPFSGSYGMQGQQAQRSPQAQAPQRGGYSTAMPGPGNGPQAPQSSPYGSMPIGPPGYQQYLQQQSQMPRAPVMQPAQAPMQGGYSPLSSGVMPAQPVGGGQFMMGPPSNAGYQAQMPAMRQPQANAPMQQQPQMGQMVARNPQMQPAQQGYGGDSNNGMPPQLLARALMR